MRCCVIIPTYNNSSTVCGVVERALASGERIILVDDGSTDSTKESLKIFEADNRVEIVSYGKNRGKGYALRKGFERAKELGYDHAITLDADGQHAPEEMSRLKKHMAKGTMVVGCRDLQAQGMPGKNTFANKFSNFWFLIQTGVKFPDTQSGFRLYDLKHLPPLWLLTNKYECELELLVYSAWHGIKIIPVNVSVVYPSKEERVSHFRPFADFTRISLTNTLLCVIAIIYGWPLIIRRKNIKKS